MANRNFQPIQTLYKGIKILQGKFIIAADASVSAPASSGAIPGIATFTKTSTGLYKITLQDKYFDLVAAEFFVSEATLTKTQGRLKTDGVLLGSSNTPNSVSFWTSVDGVATDVGAITHIYVTLQLKNSNL